MKWIATETGVLLLTLGVLCSASGCAGPAETAGPGEAATTRVLPRGLSPDAIPEVLPPAGRQLGEGYWLGALITPDDVPTLSALGVRVVLSAVAPSEETLAALRAADIEQVPIHMGSEFGHATTILDITERYAPEQVFIHCRHGADRTGVTAAFLLVVRHQWSVSDALYSVIYPTDRDAVGLAGVLAEFGIDDSRTAADADVGFYSISGTGRAVGGLKVRNEAYARLVETAIAAMRQHHPPEP